LIASRSFRVGSTQIRGDAARFDIDPASAILSVALKSSALAIQKGCFKFVLAAAEHFRLR
jgi:hypothetical protein